MRLMRKWFAWWLVLSIVAINFLVVEPTAVYACSCMRPEAPDIELAWATAVFAGRVTQIEEPGGLFVSSADPVIVTFQVSEVWKGPVQAELTARTALSSASCGYEFENGREYLVYANGSEDDLEVWLCSRTALLASAGDDLTILGAGSVPPPMPPASDVALPWLPTAFLAPLILLFLIVVGFALRRQLAHRPKVDGV